MHNTRKLSREIVNIAIIYLRRHHIEFFISNIVTRISGALIGALLFYLITNFGVWSLGSYGYNLNGILTCYTLALPFFAYSLISTFIFSGVIEFFYKLNFLKLKISK